MNTQASEIINFFEDQAPIKALEDVLVANPDYTAPVSNVTVRLDEKINLYYYLKDIILQAISTGLFEKLPAAIQHGLHSQLKAVITSKGNVNSILNHLEALNYHTMIIGLDKKLDSYESYKDALSGISNLNKKYSKLNSELEGYLNQIKEIETNYHRTIEFVSSIEEKDGQIANTVQEAEQILKKGKNSLKSVLENQQEVLNVKQEISAFGANVENYKKDIDEGKRKVEETLATMTSKAKTIKTLISHAEKALELKSTEGISAALSAQYTKENNPWKKGLWLVGAIIFLLFALIGVFLLLTNISIENLKIENNGINSIIARIVFVGISVTGATFCTNQYNKQKQIADDYGFKLVMAKSILAFTNEIKKHNEDKAIEHIKSVIEEINRSPVRRTKEEGISKKSIGLIDQLIKSIIKIKGGGE